MPASSFQSAFPPPPPPPFRLPSALPALFRPSPSLSSTLLPFSPFCSPRPLSSADPFLIPSPYKTSLQATPFTTPELLLPFYFLRLKNIFRDKEIGLWRTKAPAFILFVPGAPEETTTWAVYIYIYIYVFHPPFFHFPHPFQPPLYSLLLASYRKSWPCPSPQPFFSLSFASSSVRLATTRGFLRV